MDPSQINLNDLGDVVVPAPGVNDILTWNGANWVNQAGGGGAPTNAQYVTLALNAALTAERVLTAGTNITITDGGANNPVTIKVDDTGWTTWAVLRTEGDTDLVADSAVFSCNVYGYVGINIVDALAWLHIQDSPADGGVSRANSDVVAIFERNDDCFIQLSADFGDDAGIYFGSNGDEDSGRIYYATGMQYLEFYTADSFAGLIDGNQYWLLGPSVLSPDCRLHVMEANASATPNANAVVCIENTTDFYLQFLCGSSPIIQGILFGDNLDDDIGKIIYDHSSDDMAFYAGTNLSFHIESDGVCDFDDKFPRTDSRARGHRSGDQLNINTATWTKVELNAETYDSGNDFDTANYRYTAPVDGYYLIIGQVTWSSVVNAKKWIAAIYVNGAQKSIPGFHSGSANSLSSIVVDIQYVEAGQHIELYCWHNAGVNTPDVVGGSTQTYMIIHLLSI